MDPVTRSLGKGGVTDQKSNQRGSSEPHAGPSDPFRGVGGSYRPEKQSNQVSPTMDPVTRSLGKGGVTDQKSNQRDQVSPTLDPVTRSLREGGVTDQKSNQRDQVSPTLDPVTRSLGEEEFKTTNPTKVDQVSPTLDPVTRSLGEGGATDQKSNQIK